MAYLKVDRLYGRVSFEAGFRPPPDDLPRISGPGALPHRGGSVALAGVAEHRRNGAEAPGLCKLQRAVHEGARGRPHKQPFAGKFAAHRDRIVECRGYAFIDKRFIENCRHDVPRMPQRLESLDAGEGFGNYGGDMDLSRRLRRQKFLPAARRSVR